MKSNLKIMLIVSILLVQCPSLLALNPSKFLTVFKIEVSKPNLQDSNGKMSKLQKTLGPAPQKDEGDAADYVGSTEYVLRDHSQKITFKVTECTAGYVISKGNGGDYSHVGKLKPSIKELKVEGVSIGMPREEIVKILKAPPIDGWMLQESRTENNWTEYSFGKNIKARGGEPFCDHVWIGIKFDKNEKLSSLRVSGGGCDDSECR